MFILDIQSYKQCGRHWRQSDTVDCAPRPQSPAVSPTKIKPLELKMYSHSTFMRAGTVHSGLVFAQTHYGFERTFYTVSCSYIQEKESFVCLISAVYSLFEGTTKANTTKNVIEMFRKRDSHDKTAF